MKSKLLFLSTFLIIVTIILKGQTMELEWVKQLGGESTDVGNSIVLNVSGDVFTTGFFDSITDFNPGTGTYNLISTGGADIFISKLDASGDFVCAKQMGGTEDLKSCVGLSIVLDNNGNIYTTGYFKGTTDFDPGSGTYNLTSYGLTDIFISKLDASGDFVWAKQIGGDEYDDGNSISFDGFGNIYLTGNFDGTVDFDPGNGTYNLIASGDQDIFILKLDASGNFVWAKRMGGTEPFNTCFGYSIVLDNNDNVYTTGSFQGIVDFDPGSGVYNITAQGGSYSTFDIFISKLDASGNFVWAKAMGGNYIDHGQSIVLDNDGNIYTTGRFQETADFDPGEGTFNLVSVGEWDIFISKLDASGNFVWAKQIGGSSHDIGNSIVLDALGNVYTTGYFQGTADFNPGIGTYNLYSSGGKDIFISKLDAAGNFVWAEQIGGAGNDYGNSILLDAFGYIYATGSFRETVDFDPGSGTFNLTAIDDADIYVLKLNQSPATTEEIPSLSNLYISKNGGSITIHNLKEHAFIELFDMTGRFLGQWSLDNVNNTINLNYHTGIYLIRILINDEVLTEKIFLK